VAQTYGPGWHLPTKDELNMLYLNRDVIPFEYYHQYHSSTTVINKPNYYWSQDLFNGKLYQLHQTTVVKLAVRAVRVI
jgi:hypothetical protein